MLLKLYERINLHIWPILKMLIDWCLMPTLAVFQLYRGLDKKCKEYAIAQVLNIFLFRCALCVFHLSPFTLQCFKNKMSIIWSWTYFYKLHWNNYLYFKRLTLHLRGDNHDGIVTHGRSREFRMHMKNPAQTGSGCIRFND